jgi:DNA-binding IclR family transcriptional regulator
VKPFPIRSVGRASEWLLWLAARDGATATEIAQAFAVPLPTVHHTLRTLEQCQLLTRDRTRRYILGARVGILSDAFLRQQAVSRELMDPLAWLAETTTETAYLAAWRGGEIRIMACVEGSNAVRVAGVHTGFYADGHARATGKLLLAYATEFQREAYLSSHALRRLTARTITTASGLERELARTRERGYATEYEEFAEGVSCVSFPVRHGDTVIAAYTISAPSARLAASESKVVDAVRRAAALASTVEVARV